MKLLVTGPQGFIGKNFIVELQNQGYTDVFEYTRNTDASFLDKFCKEADFVFHLAGVNRPTNESEFMKGNYEFTLELLNNLKKHNNNCPVMFSSTTQAERDNLYGKSKKAAEDLLFSHSVVTGSKVLVYRFPNVFGKWCKPNYNSAIATFCYNISRGQQITVNDPDVTLNLVYIDDLVEELIRALNGKENLEGDYCQVPIVHTVTLGKVVDMIYSFKNSRSELTIPDMDDAFTKKLYSTYLSYLPENSFSYSLKMNQDNRGSFTEFVKTPDRGQVSVNISKPGIKKGNHWHHTKNEKFLVVSGKGVIRFRKVGSDEVLEYYVSEDDLEVVDIPPGYTHNIENLGEKDMVTIMWANEPYNPGKPDTYYLEV